ncbi:hypothetical protein DFH06DRAFT_326776 [Mycena polygramma]|nr:hypothetical protein DFH06DRAFT_326776 [Mycena polygramma]
MSPTKARSSIEAWHGDQDSSPVAATRTARRGEKILELTRAAVPSRLCSNVATSLCRFDALCNSDWIPWRSLLLKLDCVSPFKELLQLDSWCSRHYAPLIVDATFPSLKDLLSLSIPDLLATWLSSLHRGVPCVHLIEPEADYTLLSRSILSRRSLLNCQQFGNSYGKPLQSVCPGIHKGVRRAPARRCVYLLPILGLDRSKSESISGITDYRFALLRAVGCQLAV